MLPFHILIHNINAVPSSQINHISLTNFLDDIYCQYPMQTSFNRHARLPSLISNILFWLAFLLAIIILHIDKQRLGTIIRITYGSMMLLIIITSYIFVLFESKGSKEHVLLKRRIHIDMIKRELGLLQKSSKFNCFLSVKATNYFNSLTRKYIDYQRYDKSLCIRMQTSLYRNIRLIECPFNTRQYFITIPDFTIHKHRLCHVLFKFNVTIIGHDAHIVYQDLLEEFQRLQVKLLKSPIDNKTDLSVMNKLARFQRHMHFQFSNNNHQELLFGKRRSCLVYDNKMKMHYKWLLNENIFWIMTCCGLSWLFRIIFACLVTTIIVPVYIELEGAMPLK